MKTDLTFYINDECLNKLKLNLKKDDPFFGYPDALNELNELSLDASGDFPELPLKGDRIDGHFIFKLIEQANFSFGWYENLYKAVKIIEPSLFGVVHVRMWKKFCCEIIIDLDTNGETGRKFYIDKEICDN